MKKSTKIIIAVVSVLLVAAIVFAVLYFATDLFKKKPKDGFFKALDKVSAIEDNGVSYEDIVSKLKSAQSESFESNTKVTIDAKLKGEYEQYNQYLDLLKKVELNIDSKANAKTESGELALNVKYDGKDLGTINAVINSEEVGIKIDGITDKYYTISMDELMSAANSATSSLNNSSYSSYSSSIATINNILDKLKDIDVEELVSILDIKDAEISRIINRYKDVLKSSISDDSFSSEKEKITVNGKSMDATAYTVTLSAKDIMKFAKAAVSSMKDDTETLNLVVDKVNKVMGLIGQSGMKISKDNLVSLLESAATQLDSVDTSSVDFKLKITLYEANKDVVRIKVAVGDYAFTIDSVKDGDTTKGAVIIKVQDKEITLFTTETTSKGDDKYTVKLATDLSQFSAFSSSIPNGKLEMTADVDGNNSKIKLYADIENIAEVTLNFESEMEFKSVSVTKLTSSNSKSAKSLTSSEQQALTTNAIKYLATKMDAIKAIASDLGVSESQLTTLMSQLTNLNSSSTETTIDEDADDEDESTTASTPSLTENLDIDFSGTLDFSNATFIPAQ